VIARICKSTWQIVHARIPVIQKVDVVSAYETIESIMNFQHVTFPQKSKKPTTGPSADSYPCTNHKLMC